MPRANIHDTTRADLQEEFDEHALVEGYFDRDEDPDYDDFGIDITESDHNLEESPERGTAKFEGHDAEGLAIYSNVDLS
jgi:hypothetical protein